MRMAEETRAGDAQRPRRLRPRRANGLRAASGGEEPLFGGAADLPAGRADLPGLSYLKLLDELEQMQLEISRLRQLIHVDELCGIGNRRAFKREMERARALAEREGVPCHLAIIDIDDFKDINDCFGHAAGDCILTSLAALLRSSIRRTDALCRVGGDEFAIVFYNMAEAKLQPKIDRLRRAIADAPFAFAGQPISVSVSIGCTRIEFDTAASFERADAAMYGAKRLRGERV